MALITISPVTIPGWQGNAQGILLRIYTNSDFTAATGTIYPGTVTSNSPKLGTFYLSYPCTVSGTQLTIPQVVLDSTTDSPDNPDASYSAVLWDSTTGLKVQSFGTKQSFALSPTPTTITWATIFSGEANQ